MKSPRIEKQKDTTHHFAHYLSSCFAVTIHSLPHRLLSHKRRIIIVIASTYLWEESELIVGKMHPRERAFLFTRARLVKPRYPGYNRIITEEDVPYIDARDKVTKRRASVMRAAIILLSHAADGKATPVALAGAPSVIPDRSCSLLGTR